MSGMNDVTRAISGTWGQIWLDGELVGECYGLQAKVKFNKEDMPVCGTMAIDQKLTSYQCTGTVKSYKTNSRMGIKLGDAHKTGRNPRFLIISKLADPDSYGAERVAIKNVSFDDLTLVDWEAKNVGKVESPFTFTDWEYLDRIEVR